MTKHCFFILCEESCKKPRHIGGVSRGVLGDKVFDSHDEQFCSFGTEYSPYEMYVVHVWQLLYRVVQF